ncbi:hypothetical protein [Sphingomonas sp.]|uniref:hypothetical protein n=1 Tax=Sphingomonas sp. TaxID=28214 RepID=UPI002FDB8C17
MTTLTNIMVEVEASRTLLPIGAGGGLDSLPFKRQVDFEQNKEKLRKWPRHEVTRELCKNYLLNERLRRSDRMQAIDRLIGILIHDGLALPMDDFAKSYI